MGGMSVFKLGEEPVLGSLEGGAKRRGEGAKWEDFFMESPHKKRMWGQPAKTSISRGTKKK